ncbi:hypothetical protein PFISCL1PPCAC_4343, partial [Pristionchus fissidentatus]
DGGEGEPIAGFTDAGYTSSSVCIEQFDFKTLDSSELRESLNDLTAMCKVKALRLVVGHREYDERMFDIVHAISASELVMNIDDCAVEERLLVGLPPFDKLTILAPSLLKEFSITDATVLAMVAKHTEVNLMFPNFALQSETIFEARKAVADRGRRAQFVLSRDQTESVI